VFGRRARKRVKSDRSWIGSVTATNPGLPIERTSARQPSANAQTMAIRAPEDGGTRLPLGRNAGGLAEAGMESEEGTAFLSPFLGASRVAIQPIRRFYLSINLKSAFSCLAGASSLQVCALASQGGSSMARKVGQIIARGDGRWLIQVRTTRNCPRRGHEFNGNWRFRKA
jgi:hypothetical protein